MMGAVTAVLAGDVLAVGLTWAYDPAALGPRTLAGRAGVLVVLLGFCASIVEALLVGALCTALWPEPKQDEGRTD